MFELSFATAGQETARTAAAWQRPDWLGAAPVELPVMLRVPLLRPLVLSGAGKASRPGVSFKRPA